MKTDPSIYVTLLREDGEVVGGGSPSLEPYDGATEYVPRAALDAAGTPTRATGDGRPTVTDSGWRGDRRTLWTTGRAERIDMYADPRIGVSTVEIRAVIRTHDVDDNLDAAKRAAEDALRRFCRDVLAALGDA